MYIPPHFAENDHERLHAFMRANGFGTLISVIDGAPFVTLMPFTLIDEGEHGTLIGHIARANPHAATFDGTHDSICLFQGPHAYISPRWYEAPIAVPTWNYTAVEAHGRPERIEDPSRMRSILDTLVHQYEAGMPNPWSLADIPQNVGEKMIEAIVGFVMPIRRLEGKFKLNQNRSAADRAGVRSALRQSPFPGDAAVADLMED